MLRYLQIALFCSFVGALRGPMAVAGPIDTLQLQAEWRALLAGPGDTLAASSFAEHLSAYFRHQANWRAPLPRVEGARDITARGGALRIITWAIPTPAREWKHMGLIVQPGPAGGVRCIPLRDRQLPVGRGLIEQEWLSAGCGADSWVGAVYSAAEAFAYQRGTAYLLLGVAGSNAFVTRRVIETLYVTPEGDVRFGLPLIAQGQSRLGRIMLSHSARVGMEINFVEGKGQVLIDHLSPASPQYAGMPAYYGPDFSYDALVLSRGGVWVYSMNVDPTAFSKSPKRRERQSARPARGDSRIGSYIPNWK